MVTSYRGGKGAYWRHAKRSSGACRDGEEGSAAASCDADKGTGIGAGVLRRVSILRQLDAGQKGAQVATTVGVAVKMVRAVARRYEEEGLESAPHEKPRLVHIG